jgi:threonine/homoserine/homoserine lactone efflux protein
MDWALLAPFIAATILLLLTPGPVMAIVVHNTLRRGAAAGLFTALGVEFGEVIVISAVFLGLAVSQEFLPLLFRWLSIAGVFYLIWLAARALFRPDPAAHSAAKPRSSTPIVDGLTIAFSNPTTFIFYTAFFPQFIDPHHPVFGQLVVLGAIYLGASLVVDLILIISAARVRAINLHHQSGFARFAERGSAAIYIFVAAITVLELANVAK